MMELQSLSLNGEGVSKIFAMMMIITTVTVMTLVMVTTIITQ